MILRTRHPGRGRPAPRAIPAGLAFLLLLALLGHGAWPAAADPAPPPAAGGPAGPLPRPVQSPDPAPDPAPDPPPDPAPDPPPDPPPDPAPLSAAAEADLFALPRVAEETRVALARITAGDLAGAAALLDGLIARHPTLALLRVQRAAVAMLAGEPEAALAGIEAAAEAGLAELPALLGDPVFAPLAADPAAGPRLAALAATAPPPPRRPVPAMPEEDGAVAVTGASTVWSPARERLEAHVALPGRPAVAVPSAVLSAGGRDNAYDLLRDHWRLGRAAGNAGDLYDNRDRGHSALDPARFPQLARARYGEAARAADADYALNDRLLFVGAGAVFGNSSTALTAGAAWRSLPRYALTRPDGTGPMRLWQNAAANHLYVHPAHEDYGREGGDLFPANTPYLLVSRGSSRSDLPLLEAVAMILASLQPATKARLVEEGLVVPTVQFVFRRSLRTVRSRADYFSGAAHPAAFDGGDINLARMVSLAQSIEPGAIPAEARLGVLAEELGREGVDFFGQGLDEQLFDTPSAVARIWRSGTGRRSMVLSAEDSRDANGRPLAFHWHLLQGDPARVRIEPFEDGRRARVTLDWHEPFAVSEADPQLTARVDIAVFAHNGVHDSAPAILSWYFPPHETRIYEDGPGGLPRLAARDGADPARGQAYADPLLVPRTPWRDVPAYGADGRLLGWTRHRGGREDRYDAGGRRLIGDDPGGDPGGDLARAEPVAYPLARRPDGTLWVEEVSAGFGG